MKFYNPFKWHLVKINAEKFAWRRYNFGWEFMSSRNFDLTWPEGTNTLFFCGVDSVEEANTLMQQYKVYTTPKPKPAFEVKVL